MWFKRFWWLIVLIIVCISLFGIWYSDFNGRYLKAQEYIEYELVLEKISGLEFEYYTYKTDGGKEFIIKNTDIKKNNITNYQNIKIKLKKTNNLISYVMVWLNKNATIEWHNGILYELGEVKDV